MALMVPAPPSGASTRKGSGPWSKVFSVTSLTGRSVSIGSTPFADRGDLIVRVGPAEAVEERQRSDHVERWEAWIQDERERLGAVLYRLL